MARDVQLSEGTLQDEEGNQIGGTALAGGTSSAVIATWAFDDPLNPDDVFAGRDCIVTVTVDRDGGTLAPGDKLDLLISWFTGSSQDDDNLDPMIPLDVSRTPTQVKNAIQALVDDVYSPGDITISVTGGTWTGVNSNPVTWTITASSNTPRAAVWLVSVEDGTEMDSGGAEFEVVQYGYPPLEGWFADLSEIPDGAIITRLYSVVTEPFTGEAPEGTFVFSRSDPWSSEPWGPPPDIAGGLIWNLGYVQGSGIDGTVVVFPVKEADAYFRKPDSNQLGYYAAFDDDPEDLTGGAFAFVAEYIVPPVDVDATPIDWANHAH